jgi:hypothetical protein
MRTFIVEEGKIELKSPILIEGLPGLGLVGDLSVRYLVKQLKAECFAKLYSPYFPYYVVVEKDGSARLLHCKFFHWRNEKGANDLILLTGDGQAQTIEGQYDLATHILSFAKQHGVKILITVGGYASGDVKGDRSVYVIATDNELLKRFRKAGALMSPQGNPVVGVAGLLIALAKRREMRAACLLGETLGHLPDTVAAQKVLTVLIKFLGIDVPLDELREEGDKFADFLEEVQKIGEKALSYEERIRRVERLRTTYIS